jgi:hypothetical protein
MCDGTFHAFHDLFLSSSILKCVRGRIQGNVCAEKAWMCRIRERDFGDDRAGVRPHEVRSYAGTVNELESYTKELIVTVLVALPTVVDRVLGA